MNSQLNNQQTENQQEQQIFSSTSSNAAATSAATTTKENQFRQVFFDTSNKRSNPNNQSSSTASSQTTSGVSNSSSSSSSSDLTSSQANKRARLDVSLLDNNSSSTSTSDDDDEDEILVDDNGNSQILIPTPISPNSSVSSTEPSTTSNTPVNTKHHHHHHQLKKQHLQLLQNTMQQQQKIQQGQKQQQKQQQQQHLPNISNIKRYRSRSLPNVIFSALRRHNHHHHHNHSHFGTPSESVINAVPSMAFSFPQQQPFFPSTTIPSSSTVSPPPLPPVSLQSLREIDLHEILKNPQLRHDILFDPQLQFRPNLDGERGRKKKMAVDKYWDDVQQECESYILNKKFVQETSRLPPLFQTLKEILISLLPTKDVEQVNEVMDIDLLIQQLKNFAFDFVSLAEWLSQIFKSHCAPMRDSWVDEMTMEFIKLKQENSISSLVDGLRMIFSILEAMKLDVANHQIRILRPVLVETAVDFERNYFTQMINRCKMNLQDSTSWFVSNYQNCEFKPIKLKELSTLSILKLLSCRHMCTSFPTSLSFDHARLVLLRADIRQLVCLQLCILLYKQMLYQHGFKFQKEASKPEIINKLKKEILAIVTDDNGNIKWTRNIGSIALQLSKLCITAPDSKDFKTPPESMVEFAFNWLIKQTQPSSQVYGLMEEKIFKQLLEYVNNSKDEVLKEELTITATAATTTTTTTTTKLASSSTPTTTTTSNEENTQDENFELNQLGSRIAKLCNFHWNVFGNTYTEAIEKL